MELTGVHVLLRIEATKENLAFKDIDNNQQCLINMKNLSRKESGNLVKNEFQRNEFLPKERFLLPLLKL